MEGTEEVKNSQNSAEVRLLDDITFAIEEKEKPIFYEEALVNAKRALYIVKTRNPEVYDSAVRLSDILNELDEVGGGRAKVIALLKDYDNYYKEAKASKEYDLQKRNVIVLDDMKSTNKDLTPKIGNLLFDRIDRLLQLRLEVKERLERKDEEESISSNFVGYLEVLYPGYFQLK